jgi:hypothetical protein
VVLVVGTAGCSGDAIVGDPPVIDDDDDDASGPSCEDAAVAFDFSDGPQGFEHEDSDDSFIDPWEFGSPRDRDCATGDRCWATNAQDEYGDCNAGRLIGPTIDLSTCADGERSVTLSFMHFYDFEEPSNTRWWDGGLVQVRAGGEWTDVLARPDYDGELDGNFSECDGSHSANGHSAWSGEMPEGDWQRVEVTVDAEFMTDEFQFSFLFGSDRAATAEGWYVDDVAVEVEEL